MSATDHSKMLSLMSEISVQVSLLRLLNSVIRARSAAMVDDGEVRCCVASRRGVEERRLGARKARLEDVYGGDNASKVV